MSKSSITGRTSLIKNEFEPLSKPELAHLETALGQLHIELRAFLATLPVEGQSASGMSRLLRIERTTCQRVVFAAMGSANGAELAGALPGVQGLRTVTQRAATVYARQPGMREVAQRLGAAIDGYEAVLRESGGSRARLLARLRATGDPAAAATPGADAIAPREALFQAAAALTGRRSDLWLAVHVYEPTPARDRLVQTRAHGLIGHTARQDAVPLTFHAFATHPPEASAGEFELGRFQPLQSDGEGDAPAELLRQFTSRPAPIVRSKQPQEFLVQTLDPRPDSPHARFDIVFGMTGVMAHPGCNAPFLEEVWALVNFPVRQLLMDVYLHRDIARGCLPGLDLHLWRPDFASQTGERWQTRFPGGPTLQVLDAQALPATPYSRYDELLDTLLAARGLARSQLVGYRCAVDFPVWRAGYRMTFDFGAEPA